MENYGSQNVSIEIDGCMFKGTVVHELLHAAGFQHEQSRPDRDRYLNVYYKNIIPGERHCMPQFWFEFDDEFVFLTLKEKSHNSIKALMPKRSTSHMITIR